MVLGERENDSQGLRQRYRQRMRVDAAEATMRCEVGSERHREIAMRKRDAM